MKANNRMQGWMLHHLNSFLYFGECAEQRQIHWMENAWPWHRRGNRETTNKQTNQTKKKTAKGASEQKIYQEKMKWSNAFCFNNQNVGEFQEDTYFVFYTRNRNVCLSKSLMRKCSWPMEKESAVIALCCEVPSDGRLLLKVTEQDWKW